MKKMMMQLSYILLLSLPMTNLFAWQWADLWRTADQQGTDLLQKGNAQQAVQVFKNPDWKAVARYRAGNYEQAVQHFKSRNTSDSQYNAGNAYAYLGRYQEAIAAYDKAIALNPHNKDAITNREIVKKLLDKNNKQKNSSCSKNSDSADNNQKKNSENKSAGNRSSQDQKQAQNNSTEKENQSTPQNKKDQQSSQNNSTPNKPTETKSGANHPQQANDNQANPQQSNNLSASQQNPAQPLPESNPLNAKLDAGESTSAQSQSRAKEENQKQLLRRLSDNPGGLLRQKFLRDYFRRHSDQIGEGGN